MRSKSSETCISYKEVLKMQINHLRQRAPIVSHWLLFLAYFLKKGVGLELRERSRGPEGDVCCSAL